MSRNFPALDYYTVKHKTLPRKIWKRNIYN